MVRYKKGEDTDLALHGDASVVTLNVCLGRDDFEGGRLAFRPYTDWYGKAAPPSNRTHEQRPLEFSPGVAVIHRGQHKHEALPLTAGERINMVVWLFGKDGVVRVAPYEQHERLGPEQRWAAA